jgi:outer membrane protein assembly factor BamB
MPCRVASVWVLALLAWASPSAQAQIPISRDLIPSRNSLARLGLERQWLIVVPLTESQRLMQISRSADLFFAQTNGGMLHTYDVETGKLLWSASLGATTPSARPVSSNSYAIFGTSGDMLTALHRQTGQVIWRTHLGTIPSSGTICDEDRVMVGTTDGRLTTFKLREPSPRGTTKIRSTPAEEWAWQTSGAIATLPLPARHVVAFGSRDGCVYVVMINERTPLYRIRTGGPIGDGLGSYGTRTLLIPSADNNLYAIDLLTSNVQWIFPSGAPMDQAPLVVDEDIYCINERGYLSRLDPANGNVRWNTLTQGGKLIAVSGSRIYLRSWNNDLIIIDRATGQVLADPAATMQRAGLNLHEHNLSMLNRYNDRLYFGTQSGVVLCLREIGATQPRLLRDPNALPFGYIPPEGIKPTPPPPSPAEASAEIREEDKDKDTDKAKDEDKAKVKDDASKDRTAQPPVEKNDPN